MSSQAKTVEALLDVLERAGPISARSMFGEYALYMEGRVVALICDDQLFLKPVSGVLEALPGATLAPPYPGAKAHVLAEYALDDPDPVITALRAAAREVPQPKARKGRGA